MNAPWVEFLSDADYRCEHCCHKRAVIVLSKSNEFLCGDCAYKFARDILAVMVAGTMQQENSQDEKEQS